MEELCLRSAALMITRPMTCKIDHAFFNSRFERVLPVFWREVLPNMMSLGY